MKIKFCLFFILILLLGSSAFAFTEPEFKNMIQGLYDKAVSENNTLIKTITKVIIDHELEDDIYNYTGNGNGGFGAFDSMYIYFQNNTLYNWYLFNVYLFNTDENSRGYIQLLNPTGRTFTITRIPNFKNSYAFQNLSFRIDRNNFSINRNQNREYALDQANSFYIFSGGGNSTNYSMSARVGAMITKNMKIYTNDSYNVISAEDYFLKGFYPEEPPAFVFNQNNIPDLSYSQRYKYLGNLIGDYDSSLIWFKMVDQYGHIIASTENGNIVINSDDEVYCAMRLLYPGQHDLYMGYDDGDFETEIFYYDFSLASGETGWTGQDTTNNIIDNNDENTEDLIGSITRPASFSGDYNYLISGDNLANKLGKERFNLPGRVTDIVFYLNSITGQVRHVLTTSEVYTITIPYMNRNIVIRSSDFVIPDGPIKTIATNFITFIVCCLIFKHVVSVVHSIQEGNVNAILNKTSVNDDSVFL